MNYIFILFFFVYFLGENHELHPAKHVTVLGKSISTPSIVVQVCGSEVVAPRPTLEAEARGSLSHSGRRIKPTRCPDRQNSLD